MTENSTNHGDAGHAGFHRGGGILRIDPANGNHGNLHGSAHARQPVQTDHVRIVLGATRHNTHPRSHGGEHGARAKVARAVLLRQHRLLSFLRLQADYVVRAEQLAAGAHVHVVLSDVHAVGVGLE